MLELHALTIFFHKVCAICFCCSGGLSKSISAGVELLAPRCPTMYIPPYHFFSSFNFLLFCSTLQQPSSFTHINIVTTTARKNLDFSKSWDHSFFFIISERFYSLLWRNLPYWQLRLSLLEPQWWGRELPRIVNSWREKTPSNKNSHAFHVLPPMGFTVAWWGCFVIILNLQIRELNLEEVESYTLSVSKRWSWDWSPVLSDLYLILFITILNNVL